MVKVATALLLLGLCVGVAAANEPLQTQGPAGGYIYLGGRDGVCQYGFQDDNPGSGTTLGMGQQLGIHCPGPITITGIGFYVEFMVVYGQLDIVIYDGGTEVQRTTVSPQQGVNEFDTADIQVNDACIMLCPIGSYWSVCGDDFTNGPFTNCYWSNDCHCTNLLGENLMIWAHVGSPTPAATTTWGKVRMLYR